MDFRQGSGVWRRTTSERRTRMKVMKRRSAMDDEELEIPKE